MFFDHLLPNTLYICTHRCECPICRENSKSRLSPSTLFRAFTDTSVSSDPQSLPGPLHVPRGVPWVCCPRRGWGTWREADSRGERSSNAPVSIRGANVRRCRPLVAWINSVSPSKCSCPPVSSYRHIVWFTYSAASWTKWNQILGSRSSVIRSSKLMTRTRFTPSGNYCFELWKYECGEMKKFWRCWFIKNWEKDLYSINWCPIVLCQNYYSIFYYLFCQKIFASNNVNKWTIS